jgi:hypothetical protein
VVISGAYGPDPQRGAGRSSQFSHPERVSGAESQRGFRSSNVFDPTAGLDEPQRAHVTDRLAGWLSDLHGRSERPLAVVDLNQPELIVRTYIEIFEPPDPVAKRLQHAAEWVMAEFAASSTEILVHGDFWPGNWRIDGNRFTVIDWENAHWSPSPIMDEFLFPLSDITLGREDPGHNLTAFSENYRRRRQLPRRHRDEARLASIWTAAEVATRTHRRWGVVEDWALEWHRVVMGLAMRL